VSLGYRLSCSGRVGLAASLCNTSATLGEPFAAIAAAQGITDSTTIMAARATMKMAIHN